MSTVHFLKRLHIFEYSSAMSILNASDYTWLRLDEIEKFPDGNLNVIIVERLGNI